MKLLDWLNDRTDYRRLMHETLYERVPGGARWRYVWGSTLVFAFVLQVITGLMLWTAYSPSAQTAWESVYYIENVMTLGWLVRGIHHFAAQAMIVLLVLHVMQVVVDGAYKAPREVNFWLGIILMQIVLGLALTGYLLPWDQKGYYATRVATNIARATPVIGQQVQELAQGGKEYGHHTLTRFFALHAGILPALLVGFLVLHLAAFRRHGVTAPDPDRGPDVAFWPDQVLKDAVACLAVLAAVMGLTIWRHGAELNPPADPSEAFSAARPEWYFLFLFRFLKFEWVEHVGLAFGAIYVPGALMLVFVLMPLLAYFKWGHRFNVVFMFVVVIGSLTLTGVALYEDAVDEEHQLALENADRDALRAVELAELPEKIPVQGAIKLLRDDPFTQGPRLFAKHCSSCHRWNGHDGRGKLVVDRDPETGEPIVAPPTAADLATFGDREWTKSLLLDYSKHFAALENTAWHADLARADADGAADDPELRRRLYLAWKEAEMNLRRSRLRLRNEQLVRLATRRLLLQSDAAAGLDVGDELAKLDEREMELQTTIDETNEELLTLIDEISGEPADDFESIREGYETTVVKLEDGEMATWSRDNREVLSQPENAESLETLVEYLVSLGGRNDLAIDAAKAEAGYEVAENGTLAAGELEACSGCHTLPSEGDAFVLGEDRYGYPELFGYGSAEWLKAFLTDPGTEQFYGLRNHMPAYAGRLSESDLDLLVRWMLRDYPPTEIEDYPARRDADSAARPDGV